MGGDQRAELSAEVGDIRDENKGRGEKINWCKTIRIYVKMSSGYSKDIE